MLAINLSSLLDYPLAIKRRPLSTPHITNYERAVAHSQHENTGAVRSASSSACLVPVACSGDHIPRIWKHRNHPNLIDWKHTASSDDRVLLVLALPTGLRHCSLMLQQELQALVL